MWFFPVIPILVFVILVVFAALISRKLKGAGRTASGQPAPISAAPACVNVPPKLLVGCLVPFFGIFSAVGLAMLYIMFLRPVMQMLAARSWERVPCTIISSQLASHRGDDSTTYSVEIEYRYSVKGESYTSRRHDFMGMPSNLSGAKKAAVQRYRSGSQAECFVNPRQPAEAVLDRGLTADLLFGLMPLAFIAVGVGGVWFVLRMARRWQAALAGASPAVAGVPSGAPVRPWAAAAVAPAPAGLGARPSASAVPVRATPVARHASSSALPHGAQVLRPSSSPVGRLVGVLFVALFWNGILSVFLYQNHPGVGARARPVVPHAIHGSLRAGRAPPDRGCRLPTAGVGEPATAADDVLDGRAARRQARGTLGVQWPP